MAKRTKRATALKAKTRKKVANGAKSTKRRAAKRLVKTKSKRQKPSAKPRRLVAKKSTSRRHRIATQQGTLQTETTIVDVIEEPVPGVLVVTEFVETHTKPDTTKPIDIDQTVGSELEEK